MVLTWHLKPKRATLHTNTDITYLAGGLLFMASIPPRAPAMARRAPKAKHHTKAKLWHSFQKAACHKLRRLRFSLSDTCKIQGLGKDGRLQ